MLAKAKLSVEVEPKALDQKRRTSGAGFSGNCFTCGKEGQRYFECPHSRKVSIVNEVAVQDSQPKQERVC